MRTETKRHVRNPCYRVTLIQHGVAKTWLFSHSEKELALGYHHRFKSAGADVTLFTRKWREYNEG